MALSQNSNILASDVVNALAGKQDVLGYTPVKSVNGTSADAAGNVAIALPTSYSVSCKYWNNIGASTTVTVYDLIPNKPVFIYLYHHGADSKGAFFYVASGGAINASSNNTYFIISKAGQSMDRTSIAAGTSMAIYVSIVAGVTATLAVYQ